MVNFKYRYTIFFKFLSYCKVILFVKNTLWTLKLYASFDLKFTLLLLDPNMKWIGINDFPKPHY